MERNTAKRTLEKLLSVCICLCMLGAMLPAQVFAEEADTAQTEIVQDTAPKDTVYLSSADDLIQLPRTAAWTVGARTAPLCWKPILTFPALTLTVSPALAAHGKARTTPLPAFPSARTAACRAYSAMCSRGPWCAI